MNAVKLFNDPAQTEGSQVPPQAFGLRLVVDDFRGRVQCWN
jgi:hypothetical protein